MSGPRFALASERFASEKPPPTRSDIHHLVITPWTVTWNTGYDDIYAYADIREVTLEAFLDGALHDAIRGFGQPEVLARGLALARRAESHFRANYQADRALAAWFSALPTLEGPAPAAAPVPDWYDEPYEAALGEHTVRLRGHVQWSEVLVDGVSERAGKAGGLVHTETMLAFVAGKLFVWDAAGNRPTWADALPQVKGGWVRWVGLGTSPEGVWLRMWNNLPANTATRAATGAACWLRLDVDQGVVGLLR